MKMTVDREMTIRMAHAAQLEIPEGSIDGMTDAINDILDFCSLVNELDVSDTPDFTWRMRRRIPRRQDTIEDWADRERAHSASPAADGDFFRVPRIIAEER